MFLKQKYTGRILMIFCLIFLCSCAKGKIATNRIENNKKVEKALNDRIEKENKESGLGKDDKDSEDTNTEPVFVGADTLIEAGENLENKTNNSGDGGVDFDLTVMNADLVYASVYQLMVEPDKYVGKTFKVDGIYYATYYEPTNKNYHYVIIEDALACCAQGLEFVWDDGSHVYPDEYPRSQSRVEIIGTLETYTEADNKLYCRLINASLKQIS